MAEPKTLLLIEEQTGDACCYPVCGPETCGCGPVGIEVETPKAERKEAAADACCDPACGPETCG